MAATLTSADYPAIRLELSKDLDTTSLTNDVVAHHVTEAEEEVTQRAGAYPATGAREQGHWKRAAILLTAALIAPTIIAIPFFATDGAYDYERFPGEAAAKRLRAKAEEELVEIEDEDAEPVTTQAVSASVQTIARWW